MSVLDDFREEMKAIPAAALEALAEDDAATNKALADEAARDDFGTPRFWLDAFKDFGSMLRGEGAPEQEAPLPGAFPASEYAPAVREADLPEPKLPPEGPEHPTAEFDWERPRAEPEPPTAEFDWEKLRDEAKASEKAPAAAGPGGGGAAEAPDFGGALSDAPELSQSHPSAAHENLSGPGDFRLPEPEAERNEDEGDAGADSLIGLLKRVAEACEELVRQGMERDLRGAESHAPEAPPIRPQSHEQGWFSMQGPPPRKGSAASPSVRPRHEDEE